MRRGELGWAICLAGLPWSFFLIRLLTPFTQLDIWHANALWMQLATLILAGVQASTQQPLTRLPAACWWFVSWVSGSLLWIFAGLLRTGLLYPTPMLMGVANLWLILLVVLLLSSCSLSALQSIAQGVFWSGTGLIVYGWLQAMNLDPFFKYIDGSRTTDLIVGTIGNPTHFACQLALWCPLALIQPGWRKLWMLPALGLIGLCSSATAMVLTMLLGLGWVWTQSKKMAWMSVATMALTGAGWGWTHPAWLNPHGRFHTWQAWWPVLMEHSVVGAGLGFTKQLADRLPVEHLLSQWKHLHNEYLQLWIETGLIGMGLLGWLGWHLWQRRHHGERHAFRWACGWMLVLCCLMACLSFPFHLWQVGGLGLFAMCGWLVSTETV